MQYCLSERNKLIAHDCDDIAGSRLSRACTGREINTAFLGERQRWSHNNMFTAHSAAMSNDKHSVQ